ncbi:MAG: GNAT family N-acetyltransferase [Verrucomicrobiota bacterium]|nr:GNAT family N-acetyltransferase [Verrucomicrobiota bacterium]
MASETIPFRDGVGLVVRLEEVRGLADWPQALALRSKDHRFYEIAEETLEPGFDHHYVVLKDEHDEVRGIQPIFFVRQNLIEGVPALRALADFIRRVFPRFLTMRILMVGNAGGAADLGVCRAGDERWVAQALQEVLPIYAHRAKASLIVFKDFPLKYRDSLGILTDGDFTRIPSMPMTRLALRFGDFEEYLTSLSKATRKDLRRKFRKAAQRPPLQMEVRSDISPLLDEVYPLYLQVHERSPMKFEKLTKDYLRQLGQRMPERARFFIWREDGRIVAFSVALVHDGTIYDDYLGLDYSVALDLHLYFLTFRDIITWAIENGLTRYLSSPLNYEPKLHLGCDLLPLDLYVQHTNRALNRLFRHILPLLEPTRHDPVLPRFPNAHEL